MSERKQNRRPDFDYSQDGYYFVTTVTKNRINCFGNIINGKMELNNAGLIVQKQWLWLHDQYNYLCLDEFAVMPNHFHAILVIDSIRMVGIVGTGRDLSLQSLPSELNQTKIKPISELIGAFKTTSSKLIHQTGLTNFSWQRSFHDRIIRDDQEYERIKRYIIDNPKNWDKDEFMQNT